MNLIKYLILRHIRIQTMLAFIVLSLISISHIIYINLTIGKTNLIEYTPYSKWILLDSMGGFGTLYLLIMPLAISIGVSDIFIQDKNNNLLDYVQLNYSNYESDFLKIFYSSLVVFILVVTSLLINVFGMFLILPDISPDRIFNKLIGIDEFNTFFVPIYYDYPNIFIMIYIFLVAIWACIMNIFSITLSIYSKKRILAMIGSFIFQILLIITSELAKNYFIIVPPIYFLSIGTPFMSLKNQPIFITFFVYVGLSIYFYIRGMRKYELD
ncbi:hypothetical protein NEM27_11275 [Mammaliicoccus sciuri]|uniref:hypothetical protein n=1 Tax=Mammaliicoccus sciuri TaxID=1296 RepID=UPI002DBEEC5F|nr:hypothetical protein [Mammaliicoccus sciuri]MEB7067230.1 hypothetical protein [Mammaliicoccus sciuri]